MNPHITAIRTAVVVTLVTGVAAALSGCGSSDPLRSAGDTGGSQVVVGSANFPESQLLGEIYYQALTAKGVKATKKLGIGSREVYVPALKSGDLTVFPEYTGNFTRYLNKDSKATTPEAILTDLKAALPENLTALQPAKAEDKDSVTVTAATAKKYALKTLNDLAPVAKDLVIGGPVEWKTRDYGIPGLQQAYGLRFKEFKPLDAAGTLSVEALKNGTVDAVNLFTTDPAIAANSFVSLDDPKGFFLPQNVVPIVAKSAANETVTSALNAVSAHLDTPTLADLVKQVIADKKDPAQVAKAFLTAQGLA